MTRINAGIPVQELVNVHLLAEHREIKRIPNCIASGRYNINNIPDKFTLGKGHVSFFYDKLHYIKLRYEELYDECIRRGFNVSYYGNAWSNLPAHLMGDYNPTSDDAEIIRKRIFERLNK